MPHYDKWHNKENFSSDEMIYLASAFRDNCSAARANFYAGSPINII